MTGGSTRKPKKRMKTVAKQLERCAVENDCYGCWHIKYNDCMARLMADALWYLKAELEKSERGK